VHYVPVYVRAHVCGMRAHIHSTLASRTRRVGLRLADSDVTTLHDSEFTEVVTCQCGPACHWHHARPPGSLITVKLDAGRSHWQLRATEWIIQGFITIQNTCKMSEEASAFKRGDARLKREDNC
jgi:hypothetical protein